MVSENDNVNNEINNAKTIVTMSTWGDMMRRAEGEMIRKEDAIDNLDFDFKVDVAASLKQKVYGLGIQAAAYSPFDLGGIASLDMMLEKLGVTLKISDETPKRTVPTALSEWKLYWEHELKRLKDLGYEEGNPLYDEVKKEADSASDDVNYWSEMPVLGLYDRFSKRILLYPNNMKQDRRYYLVTTFVHEAMHAYFDRHHHELFSYVATVEEPLAEFGMLLFLKETNSKNPDWEWAYDKVKNKKTCYRYGAALMDQYLREGAGSRTRRDLESYKIQLY